MDKPQEIEFSNLLFGGISVVIFLVLTIILFVVVYQRRLFWQQKKFHQLEVSYQRELLESAVRSQESERERIAQDLHDEIGASLSTAKLFINQIQHESAIDESQDLAKQASDIIGDTVHNVRQIAQNLSPILLENFGFVEAISILVNRLKVTGIQVEYQVHSNFDSFTKEQQLAIYRIIQEVTSNVLKHAHATCLLVALKREGKTATLSIKDNGCGFDRSTTQTKSIGMGMETIKARAGLLGGHFSFHSTATQGTHFELIIPL